MLYVLIYAGRAWCMVYFCLWGCKHAVCHSWVWAAINYWLLLGPLHVAVANYMCRVFSPNNNLLQSAIVLYKLNVV